MAYFCELPRCVGIEACGGAHYWAREINRLGHEARLINPKFVKALSSWREERLQRCGGVVRGGRQSADAFYPSEAQQDLQALHRLRGRADPPAYGGLTGAWSVGRAASSRVKVRQLFVEVRHGYLKRWAMGLMMFRELLAEMYEQVAWARRAH